jgi:hypothetical protein
MTEILDTILNAVGSLAGAVQTLSVRADDIPEILQAEAADAETQLIPLDPQGIQEVLAREQVILLLKDSTFRPPPSPSLYMVEPLENPAELPREHCLFKAGRWYCIIAEERIYRDGELTPGGSGGDGEQVIELQKDFVLYPERRKRTPRGPVVLLLPEIGFPELEKNEAQFGICRVGSVSPSARADKLLRRKYGLPDDPNLATILIGFDWCGRQASG